MNLVGKIFVFLTFAMSLVFMAFAVGVYGTHRNWKQAIEQPTSGFKAQLEDARRQNVELNAKLIALQNEVKAEEVAKRQQLAKLESTLKEMTDQYATLKTQHEELVVKDKTAIATLDTSQQNLATLTTEVEKLRGEIRTTQEERDKLFEKSVKLTDNVQQAQGALKRENERSQQLAAQVGKMSTLLKSLGYNEDTPARVPDVKGKVLAINTDNMIEVSIGSDDGIKAGVTLEVYRDNKYMGRVMVLKTDTDRAVAKVMKEFVQGQIQKGDHVATRLKVS
jgi:myosin heavy subunit